MKTMTIEEFYAALKGQGVPSKEDLAFICPRCKTVQSAADLISVGAGSSFDEVEGYLAFSCIGRWTDAGPVDKETRPGDGCNWTLGGLFKLHDLEVVDEDGESHPRFMPASPEAAQSHANRERKPTDGR